MAYQLINGRFQAFTDAGAFAVGYLLKTYASGTTTPKVTYADAGLVTANPTTITLDARGEAQVWLGSGAYTFVLTDASGVTVWTVDGVIDPSEPAQAFVDTLRSDLLATGSASKGAGAVAFDTAVAYPATSVGGRLKDRWVSVKDSPFEAVGDGVADDTSAIVAALNSGASVVFMPPGIYKITAQLPIPAYVTLCGAGYGLFAGGAATRILKSGNFTGVVLNGASQLLNLSVEGDTGNGMDGVQVLGGRSVVRDVSSFAHGRDGIKVGDYTASAANTNIWRLQNVIARSNIRHGVFIAHEGATTAPNANAGIATGIEATSNGGHGLAMSETFDNQIFGLCSQTNGGQGLYLGNYAKGNFIAQPYTEANTAGDGLLDTGSGRNFLLGYRGGQNNDGWTNLGTGNTVWGRQGSIQDVPLHKSPEAFHDLRVLEDTTSGVWSLKKEATTRNLLIDLQSTTATADVVFKSSGGGTVGLRFGSSGAQVAIRDIISGTASVNWGTVAANSTADQTLTPAGSSSSHAFSATPLFAVPAGITISCFFNGASVVVRATNNTAAGIAVSGSVRVLGFKIG